VLKKTSVAQNRLQWQEEVLNIGNLWEV